MPDGASFVRLASGEPTRLLFYMDAASRRAAGSIALSSGSLAFALPTCLCLDTPLGGSMGSCQHELTFETTAECQTWLYEVKRAGVSVEASPLTQQKAGCIESADGAKIARRSSS